MTAGPSRSGGEPRLGAQEIVILGLLGAVLFVGKMALAGLANIEPVSLLVMVYAVVLGRKALFPVYIYVALECIVWGINLWTLSYLYVWPLLAAAAWLLRRMESPVGWAVLSGTFGACFGALCALMYLPVEGWQFALSWWVSGIPFDLLHCGGNFVMALALFRPCEKVLSRLIQTVPSLRG